MHKSTSTGRKSFRPYALASALLVFLASTGALIAGVTPATAAQLASQPDAQVAVFMVPLTILVAAILLEVCRTAWRGNIPAEAPARKLKRGYWTPGRGEG